MHPAPFWWFANRVRKQTRKHAWLRRYLMPTVFPPVMAPLGVKRERKEEAWDDWYKRSVYRRGKRETLPDLPAFAMVHDSVHGRSR